MCRRDSPLVREAVERVCAKYAEIMSVELARGVPDDEGVLQIRLTLAPGFDEPGIEALVTAVAEGLVEETEARSRIDRVGFTIS